MLQRLKKLQHFAEGALRVLKPLLKKDVTDDPAFKVVESFVPGVKMIVTATEWWFDWNDKKAVPDKALDLLCHRHKLERGKISTKDELEVELQAAGVEDAGQVYELAVNELFAQLKHPELVRYLSMAQEQTLHQITALFDDLKVTLQAGYHHLQSIEAVLGVLPKGEDESKPRFFRKSGPLATDFEHDKVYRRPEVDYVKELLNFKRLVIIHGVAASGKSVIARQAAYELYLAGWVVYILPLSRIPLERAEVQKEIERLGQEHAESLVVIEGVHLNAQEVNNLLDYRQDGWPCLIMTTRPLDLDPILPLEFINQIKDVPRVLVKPFGSVEEIIELYCRNQGLTLNNTQKNEILEVAGTSLWLLAYSLEACRKYPQKGVQEGVANAVNKDLGELQIENPYFPLLLVCLALLYRREVVADEMFMAKCFRDISANKALLTLAARGEVTCAGRPGQRYFGLPHSSLAEAYLMAAENTVWENECCGEPYDFVRRYSVSSDARNALTVFSAKLLSKDDLNRIDPRALAWRIENESDLRLAAGAIHGVRLTSPQAGAKLVKSLNIDTMAQWIEGEQSLGTTAKIISVVRNVDATAGAKLVNALDAPIMARRIEETDELLSDKGLFIKYLVEADPAAGTRLLNVLDTAKLAQRFKPATDSQVALSFAEMVKEINPTKGSDLIKAFRFGPSAPVSAKVTLK